MSKLKQDTLEEILCCPTLPSLPAVAVRVIELTQDQNVSLDELAITIQNDQGLASKVLRTVNSSFYGLREKCGTIRKALVVLGLNAVKSLALGFSLVEALKTPPDDEDPFDYMAYWRRGLYTAVAARVVASAARCQEADEAFLGGLLQDVGMFALKEALGDRYLDLYKECRTHSELSEVEYREFELTHAEVGAMLNERWRLPLSLVMPVRYHEHATAAPREHRLMVRAVAIGNIAHDVLTDKDPRGAIQRFTRRSQEWFELDSACSSALLEEISAGAKEMSGLFNLDTGAGANAAKLADEARQLSIDRVIDDAASRVDSMSSLTLDAERVDPITGMLSAAAGQTLFRDVFERARLSGGSSDRMFASVRVAVTGLPSFDGAAAIDADRAMIGVSLLLNKYFEAMGGVVSRSTDTQFDVCIEGAAREQAVRAADSFKDEFVKARASFASGAVDASSVDVSVGVVCYDGTTAGVFQKPEHVDMAVGRAVTAARAAGGACVRVFRPKLAA